MIVRELRRVVFLVGPLVVLVLLSASLWHSHSDYLRSNVGALLGGSRPAHATSLGPETHRKPTLTPNETHYEIYSVTSPSGKYFDVRFGKHAYNVNIIPHPKYNNSWYAVAQLWQGPDDEDKSFKQVGCVAQFIDGTMMCIDYMAALSYKPTPGGHCEGDLVYFNLNVGPHDARVFFGPQSPLTIYGSNSGFTCFGLWMQDFRELVEWEHEETGSDAYKEGTELKRPAPYSVVEKNYFVFWDHADVMHVHYDIFPKRAYAKLERDGSFGPELAATSAPQDEKCLARYLPQMPEKLESIHQATNSLKITLCRRADKDCTPSDENTFILTIIQHKTYYDWHGEYEPYAVLFRQRAPFELYGISKKPLWIHGRQRHAGRRTDMFYVTSVNWRDRGVNYHGYLDDVVFVGFGVEDKFSGAIDVQAGDLLVDMGFCDEV